MKLLDLGIKDYQETLALQYQLVEKRVANEIEDTLILVEHPHVITMGRKGKEENIFDHTIPLYKIERGGDVTYHGFGQIVGYPIIDFRAKKDVDKFLRALEEIIILTLKHYQIEATRKTKYTGVWRNEKKIASIGVSFKNWVSYHGFSLNVSTDLSYFLKLNPCGLDGDIMTSMTNLTHKSYSMDEIKETLFFYTKELFSE